MHELPNANYNSSSTVWPVTSLQNPVHLSAHRTEIHPVMFTLAGYISTTLYVVRKGMKSTKLPPWTGRTGWGCAGCRGELSLGSRVAKGTVSGVCTYWKQLHPLQALHALHSAGGGRQVLTSPEAALVCVASVAYLAPLCCGFSLSHVIFGTGD